MIRRRVDQLLNFLLWVILAAMALVVAANVFCRFVLHASLYWGDEVAQIMLVWLTFLGAAVAVRDNQHYYLNYVTRIALGKRRLWLLRLRAVLSLLAIGVLLYFGAIVTLRVSDWIMPATEISRALVYGACPVGSLFMLYYALGQMAELFSAGSSAHLVEATPQDEPL